MHGGDVYVNPEQGYDFPTRWYVRPPLRWTLRHASALTAITEDCRQHALARRRAGPSGSGWSSTAPISAGSARRPTARAWIRASGRSMIFACRQLFPRKGIRFLVEAAAQLKPRFPELKLVLAGDGFERPDAGPRWRRSSASAATSLSSAGCRTRRCRRTTAPPRVSVMPSLEEGFGIPAAEAMGCEVPVVASDAGGLPEVVEHGVTGLIVPRGDADALAQAIGVAARRPGAAAADGRCRAGAGAPALRLGSDRGAVRGRSTARSAPRCAGERAAVRRFGGTWITASASPMGCPGSAPSAAISACPTPSSSTWAGPPTSASGWARAIGRSKAKLADRDAVHLIKKTGWPRFLLETALARPVGSQLRARAPGSCRPRATSSGLHGGMDHVDLEPPVPRAARRGPARRTWTSPTATSCGTSGDPPASPLRGSTSDERVMRLLDRLGFLYNGDAIGGEPHRAVADGRRAAATGPSR